MGKRKRTSATHAAEGSSSKAKTGIQIMDQEFEKRVARIRKRMEKIRLVLDSLAPPDEEDYIDRSTIYDLVTMNRRLVKQEACHRLLISSLQNDRESMAANREILARIEQEVMTIVFSSCYWEAAAIWAMDTVAAMGDSSL